MKYLFTILTILALAILALVSIPTSPVPTIDNAAAFEIYEDGSFEGCLKGYLCE